MTHDSARRAAYAAWVTVCVVWGTTYLGIRIALETIPPALVGGIRYSIAGGVLVVALRARGEPLPPRTSRGRLVIVGILLIVVGNGFVIWAEQWVASGISAVVIATSPFWMSSLEAVVPGGEPLARRTVAGLLVGFGGIVLLVWPDLRAGAGGHQFLWGIVALQLACVGWAAGSIYSKRYAPQQDALASAAVQMLAGGIAMLAIGTITGEWKTLTFTGRTAGAELYLIVFGSLIGYSAYLYALERLPISTVSLYAYANPVIAVMLGTLLLDEPFGPRELIAAAMVLTGIATVRWRPRPIKRLFDR